ncbi:type 2 periplasmic-binding domain-containing protein [Leptothrix discophora]|uniref:Tripartite tricarboxylate transporter substrate-binding protein n=1 Tax=Leptothrix discophora TaxID=89 RepID=A0ABT9FZ70_LEPDI|nr:tripartite tricarboxylate transporter substrate-binding protein [Leptothrix discophora]MDP4299529.1 tripartite tricarboxylate transporter substrate-binding protein [Leptothrix discophora]
MTIASAPARTPSNVIDEVSRAIVQAIQQPGVKAQLEQQGAQVIGSSPAQLAESTALATQAWKAFVQRHDFAQE